MKKTKKVIEIEARTGKTIQELLFLCVERDYTMNKAKKILGVSCSKTVKSYIHKYAKVLSDHKFKHSNIEFSRKRLAHMRALHSKRDRKSEILIDGFLMTRKEHCERLGVKYDTFIRRKSRFGISDAEALGVDMTWKAELKEKRKYKYKYKEKIIKLGASDGLPVKTISHKHGIPIRVSREVMSDFRSALKEIGLLKTKEAVKITGLNENTFRTRYRRGENFPKPVKIGRIFYWREEDIELYASKI